MLAVALGAIRARRTQAGALLVIAVLVTAAAVAAPFFVLASSERVALRDVAAAPVAQRVVTASRDLTLAEGVTTLQRYRDEIAGDLSLARFGKVGGATIRGQVTGGGGGTSSPLAVRDGVCGQVEVQGSCPTGTGDAMMSTRTAAALGVRVGDPVRFVSATDREPVTLRISGLYRPRNPDDPYWGVGAVLSVAPTPAPGVGPPAAPPDAVFVDDDTFIATGSSDALLAVDFTAAPDVLRGRNPRTVMDAVDAGAGRLKADGYQIRTALPDLIAQVLDDQRLILLGVPLGAGQLVLFGWFALFLAVTMGATARRADLGLLKLRGTPRRRIWALAIGQSALPVLAGVLPGALLGWLLARTLAGGIADAGQARTAFLLAAGAAAVAVLGGLAAALIVERRTVRTDVVELLRHAPPPRRSGWRGRLAELVDLAIAILALAGVYQVHTAATGRDAGLAVLAPGLVALAAGLLLARLLVPVAARAAVRALRAGRAPAALTAVYLARRPGLERLFALLTVAVAVAGYGALAWDTSTAARHQRATAELGADRVLTLESVGNSRLLAAVRAADPSGRWAMAVVQAQSSTGVPGVLAVDSARLARVASWAPGYGVAPAGLAALLHPPAPPPVRVTAARLTLAVTVAALGTTPVYLAANLTGPDGQRTSLRYGPLAMGAHRYPAASPACARAPGCRLDGFALTSGFTPTGQPLDRPGPGVDLVLSAFGPDAAAGVDASAGPADLAGFRDPSRWRPTADVSAAGPVLAGGPDGLRVSLPADEKLSSDTRLDGQIYLVDAPTPVPVLLAGGLRDAGLTGAPGVDLFGSAVVPVRPAARAAVLPRLGASGVVVDLDYADRLVGDGGGAVVPQVWLAAGAPTSIVDGLVAAGLRVTGDETVAGRQARYGESGPAIALRFQLLGAALAVILAAAGLVLVAAVERGPRADELAALRAQGLTGRAARAVAFGGYAWLAGGALLAGLLVAPVDRLVSGAGLPLFVDGWRVLPPPARLRPGALLVAAALAAVVLGATAALASARLIRRVSR
jgi:hypothetical protein